MDSLKNKVLVDKYYLRDSANNLLETTEEQLWDRVAIAVSSAEQQKDRKKWQKSFYWLLENWKFVPGGRILYGAGNTERSVTTNNCYFIPITSDSIEGIYRCMYEVSKTLAWGGGCGIDLSLLRPAKAPVKNSARSSSGVVPIANQFSNTSGLIGQHGRIGAIILTLHCNHPDILDFIRAKDDSERKFLRFANISVLITDKLMEAVATNSDFELWYPDLIREVPDNIAKVIEEIKLTALDEANARDFLDGSILWKNYKVLEEVKRRFAERAVAFVYNGYEQFYNYDKYEWFVFYSALTGDFEVRKRKTYAIVKAVDLWDTIIERARNSAEPGVLFYDNMRSYSTTEYGGMNVIGCNPCLVGDTLVNTDVGVVTIESLVKRRLSEYVYNEYGKQRITRYIDSGVNDVYELTFDDGKVVRATSYHKFVDEFGKFKKVIDINIGDKIKSVIGEVFENKINLGVSTVISIVSVGRFNTYCLTVEPSHTFIANGLISGNCGEVIMSSYGACCLGSINLSSVVSHEFTNDASVDYTLLEKLIRTGVRFLDDVLDYNAEKHPLKQQAMDSLRTRRIGLGTTGLADMLCKLRLKYDTDEAISLVNDVYKFIKEKAYDESYRIACEKGSFPAFDPDKHWKQKFYEHDVDIKKYDKLRNASLLSVPPVGSGSLLTQTSSGVEPIFAISYTRRSESLSKGEFKVYHNLAQEYMKKFNVTKEEDLPSFFVTSDKINHEFRVLMQSTIQRHTCLSISSCLVGDSLITTDKGFIRLDNFKFGGVKEFKKLGKIKSLNCYNKMATLNDTFNNGVDRVKTIVLADGVEISGTENHKVLVLNDELSGCWKELRDVKVGDRVVCRNSLNMWGCEYHIANTVGFPFKYDFEYGSTKKIKIPKRMSVDLARFLGYYCSDGSSNVNGVALSQVKNNVVDDWVKIVYDVFGLKAKVSYDKRVATSKLCKVTVNSRALVAWLDYIGIKAKGVDKRIPSCVLRGGPKIVANFIRGLTLDGHVKKTGIVVLTNRSKRLILETQQLLYNFGIRSFVGHSTYSGHKYPGGYIEFDERDIYTLHVPSGYANKFLRFIGFAEERKQKHASLLYKSYYDRDGLIGGVSSRHFIFLKARQNLYKIKSSNLYDYIKCTLRKCKNDGYSRSTIQTFVDLGLLTVPDMITDKTYRFEKVKSVRSGGRLHTYDLSVRDGRSYLANGVQVHNTINLPADVTVDTVKDIYVLSWKHKCKGVTVYRQGSREDILSVVGPEKKTENKRRNVVVSGKTVKVKIHDDTSIYVTVNFDDVNDQPFEIFVNLGKSGSEEKALTEALGRLCSLYLKGGGAMNKIIETLIDIRGGAPVFWEGMAIQSLPDALAKALLTLSGDDFSINSKCPSCKSMNLRFENGCYACASCGYSKCGG